MNQNGFDVIRNTCYIFNRKHIWRHDKITPINEKHAGDENALYQPGNKKNVNNSPICTILHPITNYPITMGVEICREHWLGVLKGQAKKHRYFTLLFQLQLVSNQIICMVIM